MEVNENTCKAEIENNDMGDVFLDIVKTEFEPKGERKDNKYDSHHPMGDVFLDIVKTEFEPKGESKDNKYDCLEFLDYPVKTEIRQDEDTVISSEAIQVDNKSE
ncbi:unnamed protein product [Diabrotica balteata]|uniref:Uncharacterized protein n=1 Tax=Diabrotica balteata TaxID=107213 RepID=A0A9N9SS92_DIABA|nr:unnamed protein product [Diabrotica balteata]